MSAPPERPARHVRGRFFAEYVRMIRGRKGVAWERLLGPEDLRWVHVQVEPEGWYPMDVFERLGVAILDGLEGATLDAVRLWGRFSASQYAAERPLVADGDPVESLMRLKVVRNTLFDFPAFDIPTLAPDHAEVHIGYGMGHRAEEAACVQTMGFCEGVLDLAGARDVSACLASRVWAGDARTQLLLDWK